MTLYFAKAIRYLTRCRGARLFQSLTVAYLLALTGCAALDPATAPVMGNASATSVAPAPEPLPMPAPASPESPVIPWSAEAFIGKEWRLATLFGAPANQMPSPRLQWLSSGQVVGSGGCNRFSGRSVLTELETKFGPLASTRMACVPEPSSQEDRFFKALEMTVRAKLKGGELQLLDHNGNVVAQLVQD